MRNILFRIFFIYLSVFFVFTGCNNRQQLQQKKQNSAVVTPSVSCCEVMDVDKLLENTEALNGKIIKVEGVCTHICRHGGKKIFLMGSSDNQVIRIEAGSGIDFFDPGAVDHIVEVTGKMLEQRINEEFLKTWEEGIKKSGRKKHGKNESGCASEQKANKELPATSEQERIDNFRQEIALRKSKEGKDYLSFYFIQALSYRIK